MTDNLPVPAQQPVGWRYVNEVVDAELVPAGQSTADLHLSDAAQELIDDAKAPNTRRSYAGQRKAFREWCAGQERPRCPLPATGETLAEYATYLVGKDRSPRTIEQAVSAIRTEHEDEGLPKPPTKKVQDVLRAYKRRRASDGKRTKQAPAVLLDHLRKMVDAVPDGVAGVRDRALIVLGWAMMARRSELVALNWTDIVENDEGIEVLIRQSKTDQDAVGEVVTIPYGSHPDTCPVRLLRAWRSELGARDLAASAVFRSIDRHGRVAGEEKFAGRGATRISGDGVAKALRRAAVAAGLPGNITPHGLRSGGATESYRVNKNAVDVARHGRWADGSPVFYRYIRTIDKWTNNPMRGVGL